MTKTKIKCFVLACAQLALLTGCSMAPVQAWQKGTLARPEMGFEQDRVTKRYDEHIYSSREAASGGATVGGGGCGCN